jgi:hypothetical protein
LTYAGTYKSQRYTQLDQINKRNVAQLKPAWVYQLRAAGVWDEVAALDPFALEKAFAEKKWAPEVLERLRAYLSTEKRYTVTLKEES